MYSFSEVHVLILLCTHLILCVLSDFIRYFFCIAGRLCASEGLFEFGGQFFSPLREESSLLVSINTILKVEDEREKEPSAVYIYRRVVTLERRIVLCIT